MTMSMFCNVIDTQGVHHIALMTNDTDAVTVGAWLEAIDEAQAGYTESLDAMQGVSIMDQETREPVTLCTDLKQFHRAYLKLSPVVFHSGTGTPERLRRQAAIDARAQRVELDREYQAELYQEYQAELEAEEDRGHEQHH
jgi:hypothetical protein